MCFKQESAPCHVTGDEMELLDSKEIKHLQSISAGTAGSRTPAALTFHPCLSIWPKVLASLARKWSNGPLHVGSEDAANLVTYLVEGNDLTHAHIYSQELRAQSAQRRRDGNFQHLLASVRNAI